MHALQIENATAGRSNSPSRRAVQSGLSIIWFSTPVRQRLPWLLSTINSFPFTPVIRYFFLSGALAGVVKLRRKVDVPPAAVRCCGKGWSCGPKCVPTLIVSFQALLNIRCVADIKTVIGVAWDIDEKGTAGADADMIWPVRLTSFAQGIQLAASFFGKFFPDASLSIFQHRAAMSERSESNGASGTPVELVIAFLEGFRSFPVKLSRSL
jgi:hypothetical protein